jgi:hypothetical protein
MYYKDKPLCAQAHSLTLDFACPCLCMPVPLHACEGLQCGQSACLPLIINQNAS